MSTVLMHEKWLPHGLVLPRYLGGNEGARAVSSSAYEFVRGAAGCTAKTTAGAISPGRTAFTLCPRRTRKAHVVCALSSGPWYAERVVSVLAAGTRRSVRGSDPLVCLAAAAGYEADSLRLVPGSLPSRADPGCYDMTVLAYGRCMGRFGMGSFQW